MMNRRFSKRVLLMVAAVAIFFVVAEGVPAATPVRSDSPQKQAAAAAFAKAMREPMVSQPADTQAAVRKPWYKEVVALDCSSCPHLQNWELQYCSLETGQCFYIYLGD